MRIFSDPRTGIKYADLVVGGKRRRVSLKTKDNKVAILRASKLADDKQAEREGKISLANFLIKYRSFLQATRKPDTAYHFELGLKKLLNHTPIKYLDEITPALLDELAITLKSKLKGPSAAGLNRCIQALKTAMRQAEFWDLIPPQNWRKVSKFKEKKGRVEFHTKDELKILLKHLGADWQLVVLLGARAGLRRGEMAALKWNDVDFRNGQIYVAPNKTEGHRYVPLTNDLRQALKTAKKRAKNDFVVNVGDNTKRNGKAYLSAYYRKLTADLPFDCKLHKLRHTYASHLVQAGVDLYRVSKLLGHSSIQMTEIYAHLAPADLKSAVKMLPPL